MHTRTSMHLWQTCVAFRVRVRTSAAPPLTAPATGMMFGVVATTTHMHVARAISDVAAPNVSRAFVFSNSDHILDALAETDLDVARDGLVFCNHGGPAADKLLVPLRARRPSRVDWVLNYNPFARRLNGCPSPGKGRQPLRHYGRRFKPPLLVGFWVLVHDQDRNNTARISRLARVCLGTGNFRLLDVGLVWTYALAAVNSRSSFLDRSLWNQKHRWWAAGRDRTKRPNAEPSAGVIAALHERLSLPRDVQVHAVGFDGHCSTRYTGSLRDASGGNGSVSSKRAPCRKLHDFAAERALMRALGIRIVRVHPANLPANESSPKGRPPRGVQR